MHLPGTAGPLGYLTTESTQRGSMALRCKTAGNPDRRRNAALEVMEWVRAILDTHDDAIISVTGHQCGAPECGDAETVILLMRADQPTVAIKISKSIETVTDADVCRSAAAASASRARDLHSLISKSVTGDAPLPNAPLQTPVTVLTGDRSSPATSLLPSLPSRRYSSCRRETWPLRG